MTMTPREHIEHIRRTKYWIGVGSLPVKDDLCMSVKYLSAELYSKDIHFLMELVQNAEDNEYDEGVEPSLEFVFTSKDITGTGAPTTLLIFNNEKGFSQRNIDSICSVGNSTKAGKRKQGYIGEKGIGFKSVFLLTSEPYIFSNGYQIRFSEKPCPDCDIAYIVPEWVEDTPTISSIREIYGSGSAAALPTTTLILPLKADKVQAVKKQLSSIHSELLLFLSKIRRLSVREDTALSSAVATVREIYISSQVDFMEKKNIDAESYTLHLSADKGDSECSYYMWRQRFPVKVGHKEERRMGAEEWSITLAFPRGERLGNSEILKSVGIYAFLPTEMVTNFPFIIQADFILASSREAILLDNKWNQGILECVPAAFMNAFVSLVKTTVSAPLSSLPPMFSFLPVKKSEYQALNAVRNRIRENLLEEHIIPSESHSDQKFFHKPCDVARIFPAFWDILIQAKKQGLQLYSLNSHGKHILHHSFDIDMYNDVLEFLGVDYVGFEWYSSCIQSCNLVSGVTVELYSKLLSFVAQYWNDLKQTDIKKIPLLKYIDPYADVSLLSISGATKNGGPRLCISQISSTTPASWLIGWSRELKCAGDFYFFPEDVHLNLSGRSQLLNWLKSSVNVEDFDVQRYARSLLSSLIHDEKLPILFAHFLHHSVSKGYLSEWESRDLCKSMPLAVTDGRILTRRNGILVPAKDSKWVELLGSNPWVDEGYYELRDTYLHAQHLAGQSTSTMMLMPFLKRYVGATDIPSISPPDAEFPTVSAPLTKDNAFLLLDWIQSLKSKGSSCIPGRFLDCIKKGSWLKVKLNGCVGYRPPCQSFFHSSSWGSLLQNSSVMVDIPLVDQEFYGSRIQWYKEELKAIGVMFEFGEACQFIGKHLMSLASKSNLTGNNVLTMLKFIRFLREKYLPPDEFIASVKTGNWLKTSCGYRSPVGSVLYDDTWKEASLISDIPFILQEHYGGDIYQYKVELQLLGVAVGFNGNYRIVVEYLRSISSLTNLSAKAFILLLECARECRSSSKIVAALKESLCIKSKIGYKYPRECFLADQEWGCILHVFQFLPIVDGNFYGDSIFKYTNELKMLGVVVDVEVAMTAFSSIFKQQASGSKCCITKENVMSLLACYRKLKQTVSFPVEFTKCLRESKWVRTRLGDYRTPNDCILFNQEWESISRITLLPFIDDSGNFYGQHIHEYASELKSMGVVVNLKVGSKFVLSQLFLPKDPSDITPSSVLSLLECFKEEAVRKDALPDGFLKKINQRWLKTTFGYNSPNECVLYDSKWASSLQRSDGPFIDEDYYGPSISSYCKELGAVGVIIDGSKASALLASYLEFHTDYTAIVRIYTYLKEKEWQSTSETPGRIWIPKGSDDRGMWVSPKDCILHDKEGLFGSLLYVLDGMYKAELHHFFCQSMGVRCSPSIDHFSSLWKDWECANRQLSHAECFSFWSYMVKHWSPRTEKIITESVLKVPVASFSGEILLVDKSDVFIPDDLLLKEIFVESSSRPLFVWYPQSLANKQFIPQGKLNEIYAKIGVKKISDAVTKDELSEANASQLNLLNSRDFLIGKGLARLILGFLANDSVGMEPESRHKLVKTLLDANVFQTPEPITAGYSLALSSGDVIRASASLMIRWERDGSYIYTQKFDRSADLKHVVEYATHFSEVVSEGLLWEKQEYISKLSELIKFGFLVDFDEDAIIYILKSKNLQIFVEDEDFLSSAFSSDMM